MLKVVKKVFIVISILFIGFMISFYGYRLYYFYSSEHKNEIAVTLSKQIIANSKDLVEKDDMFYFYGDTLSNYLYFSGIMYRIINFNDEYLTLIADEDLTKLKYGLNDNYDDSDVKSWLENRYLKDINLELLYNQEISLLDIDTYKKVNAENSFIKSNDMWIYDNNKGLMLDKNGSINTPSSYQYFLGIRPVIKVKNINYISGKGTINNPYILEKVNTNTLIDTYVGQYIKYKNNVYRIISKDDGVKVVSTNSIGKYKFSDSGNSYNSTSVLYKYLNEKFLATLNKDDILLTKWKSGVYNLSYKDVESKNVSSYIGLLTIGDYFIQDISGYILAMSKNTVFTIQEDKSLFLVFPNKKLDIYPAFSLKEELKINDGLGTKNNPYEVGEE